MGNILAALGLCLSIMLPAAGLLLIGLGIILSALGFYFFTLLTAILLLAYTIPTVLVLLLGVALADKGEIL